MGQRGGMALCTSHHFSNSAHLTCCALFFLRADDQAQQPPSPMFPTAESGIPFLKALQLVIIALCVVVFIFLKLGSDHLKYSRNIFLQGIGWFCWVWYKPFAEITVGFHEASRGWSA